MRDELLGERLSHDIWATSKRLFRWLDNNRLADGDEIDFTGIGIDLADAMTEIDYCLAIIKKIVSKDANP